MPEALQRLPAPLLDRLSALLAEEIGLHFPPERYGDLRRGIGAAARELGHASVEACIDRLIPDIEEWNITILATDINPEFLRKAAEGTYREWSFRGTPAWLRERYFRKKNGCFEILPALRKRVTFSYLNLAVDAYPSLSNNTNAMDVIFCRNVLMYFTPAQAKKVAGNLHGSLVEGGWLIVSPVEASNSLLSRFAAVGFPGAVLYRKALAPAPAALPQ